MSFDDGHVERNRRLYGHLLPMIRGRGFLWHCTGPDALYSIVRDGAIRPSGDLPTPWTTSLGVKLGAVCLFDFDSAEEDCAFYSGIVADWVHWFGTALDDAARICIAIDRARLDPGRLIPAARAAAEIAPDDINAFKRVAYLECWHRGPVPVGAFSKLYMTKAGTLDHVEVPIDGRTVETVRAKVAAWAAELERERQLGPDDVDISAALAEARARDPDD